MENIHVLPTDKPSRLIFNSFHKSFCYQKEIDGMYINDGKVSGADFWGLQKALNNGFKPQNIYITSDEEVKDGEYGICLNLVREGFKSHQAVFKMDAEQRQAMEDLGGQKKAEVLKVILTTDQDLIKDSVQAIDDDFLEWFVKNPSCEEVEIKKNEFEVDMGLGDECIEYSCYYIPIIPKEEPKRFKDMLPITEVDWSGFNKTTKKKVGYVEPKEEPDYTALLQQVGTRQETLEELAKRILANNIDGLKDALQDDDLFDFYKGVIQCYGVAMAKWQQERSYSEEEVLSILQKYRFDFSLYRNIQVLPLEFSKWFEQFKKK